VIILLAVAAFFLPPAVAVAVRDYIPVDITWITVALIEFAAFGFSRHLALADGTAVLALILGLFSVQPRRVRRHRPSRPDRREDREVRKFRRELEAFGDADPVHAALYDPKPGDRKVAG
jgi:hypothetical protein